jgi:hypothetical protein
MSVTTTTADAALKDIYLDIVRDQVNISSTAVYNKIKVSTKDIQGVGAGHYVIKLAPFGVNGGVGAGTESGALPESGGNNYVNFKSQIKCLYGVIELTDLSIQASKSDRSSFVNLLKAEMDGLLKGAKHSYGRQIYLDGTGNLTACGTTSDSLTVNVDSVQYLVEGMTIDILTTSTGVAITNGTARRIANVDRVNKTITLTGAATVTTTSSMHITEQGALNNELTGFGAVFTDSGSLYGLAKSTYSWLIPQLDASIGDMTDKKIINYMMDIQDYAGGNVDFIPCIPRVYTEYYDYLESTKRNANTLDLKGGFKALSINGVPMTPDKFVEAQSMNLLDTSQWTFHQLLDWAWMEDNNGSVLTQVAGYPKWTATIRKYAELLCDHPYAQAKLSGITIS